MKIQIGRKFIVRNDPDNTVYLLSKEGVNSKGSPNITVEWDWRGKHSSTSYYERNVIDYFKKGSWVYVKNFNDYLKICK